MSELKPSESQLVEQWIAEDLQSGEMTQAVADATRAELAGAPAPPPPAPAIQVHAEALPGTSPSAPLVPGGVEIVEGQINARDIETVKGWVAEDLAAGR